jgi:hypothetical protein
MRSLSSEINVAAHRQRLAKKVDEVKPIIVLGEFADKLKAETHMNWLETIKNWIGALTEIGLLDRRGASRRGKSAIFRQCHRQHYGTRQIAW